MHAILDSLKSRLAQIPDDYEDTVALKSAFQDSFESLSQVVAQMQDSTQHGKAQQGGANVVDDGHGGRLNASHPDWMNVAADPLFSRWCQADQQRLNISKNGNTDEVIWLLSTFKQARTTGQLIQELNNTMTPAAQQAQQAQLPAGHQNPALPMLNNGAAPAPSLDQLNGVLNDSNDKFGQRFAENEALIDAALQQLSMG